MNLSNLNEEQILDLRIRDLPVKIENTWLSECINKLYEELQLKNLLFRPSCYLADEWLTPEGEPIIGIPFYLADEALMRLEKKMMLEVEGGTKEWCMKLLRHETGHAINYAYQLFKKPKWKKVFGSPSATYADTYRFRPYSKAFVRHLEDYYAQYHPDEDFAETFAVWLTPDSNWQNRYKNWKALKKLEYMDSLMNKIKKHPALVKKGKKYWQASRIKSTLKNYYKKRKNFSLEDFPDFHDTNLSKIFTAYTEETQKLPKAYDIINRYKKEILNNVSAWTGEKKYIINDVLKNIKSRCKKLKLVSSKDETTIISKITAYITTLVMNYLHTGRLKTRK
ncbi:MAG: putative zinc-binding metallopeptidase [Candidatus Gygaella obscura]|nr:putative zinc-binding metallopeptidase [Candidatus Gygaella obscura]